MTPTTDPRGSNTSADKPKEKVETAEKSEILKMFEKVKRKRLEKEMEKNVKSGHKLLYFTQEKVLEKGPIPEKEIVKKKFRII